MAAEITAGGTEAVPMASESTKDSIASGIQSQFDAVFGNDDADETVEATSETPAADKSETSAPAAADAEGGYRPRRRARTSYGPKDTSNRSCGCKSPYPSCCVSAVFEGDGMDRRGDR